MTDRHMGGSARAETDLVGFVFLSVRPSVCLTVGRTVDKIPTWIIRGGLSLQSRRGNGTPPVSLPWQRFRQEASLI